MRQALGKGLEALIPAAPKGEGGVRKVPVEKVRPNRHQPRREFSQAGLEALAASIRKHGLAQPIAVCHDGEQGFELIAGERRLRAAKLAGLTEIDAVVRPPLADSERLALALIENLQREDLNPIEEALGIKRLIAEFGLTQQAAAESVGRSRPVVANLLRLLELEPEIQDALRAGRLSEAHGLALLSVDEAPRRRTLFARSLADGWTVRQLQRAAKARAPQAGAKAAPEVRAVEEALQKQLGTKVEVRLRGKDKGTIRVHFYSLDDFDRLFAALKRASA